MNLDHKYVPGGCLIIPDGSSPGKGIFLQCLFRREKIRDASSIKETIQGGQLSIPYHDIFDTR